MIPILLILAFIGIFVISGYNSLIAKRNQAENAFAGIDVQLKKRYDLIPQLVETVRGYMNHEREVLSRLTQLRATPYAQMSEEQKGELDKGLSRVMQGLTVTLERYPDLKASDNFMHLQRTINETEEQLAAARRSFNAAVTDYNTSLQSFPTNILAGMFGFRQRRLFEAATQEREVKNVEL